MKRNLTLFLALTVIATFVIAVPARAKGNEVRVKIAPFYTEIENVSVDNRYVEYPLITYKDITYFPMTYNLCAFLGLRSGFDAEKGLYIISIPGSYDPVTVGHMDVIRRTAALFDQVYVCVVPNAEKTSQMFTPEEKLPLVQEAIASLPNVTAELWPGLLADFARQHGATVVIRGIRSVSDFDLEASR